ncbi:MAG: hypothetical protein ACRDE7_00275 [Sphingobacterium sp.]
MAKEKTNLQKLSELDMEDKAKKFPNFPKNYIPRSKFTGGTANSLTKAVIAWIQLHGGQAERINTMGVYRNNKKKVTDVVGFTKEIGSGQWTKGTGTPGSADISATIKGRSVKIEIKIGKDRQSEAQKQYQAAIEKAGGVYIIVKDFDSFVEWYEGFVARISEQLKLL